MPLLPSIVNFSDGIPDSMHQATPTINGLEINGIQQNTEEFTDDLQVFISNPTWAFPAYLKLKPWEERLAKILVKRCQGENFCKGPPKIRPVTLLLCLQR